MVEEPKWPDIAKWAETEIELLRNRLEATQGEEATELLRGEIRALRRLLKYPTRNLPPDPQTAVQADRIDY